VPDQTVHHADPTVHHAGLTVSDLDRAVAFYTETFGLTVVDEFAVGGDAFADAVDVAGASASFAHLAATDSPVGDDPSDPTAAGDDPTAAGDDPTAAGDGTRIELVEYAPAGDPTGATALNRPGAAHVALAVDDVESFHASLDADVETLSPPRTTESGTTISFVTDPDGHLVEVLET
jgi:catechol 2,3-dioxygenase-like lactoylglutathione lyase family enzyme